ncbi:MAG TPA: RICIN domain-containing protein [Acidobacteriaceae bacterium]|nr:RICIN domain-containing protein [Acidobacteriaceae bacterium]
MKLTCITSVGSLAAVAVTLSGLLASPQANAQGQSAAAYSAYNSQFLVHSGSNYCYATTLVSVGTNCAITWIGGNDLEIAMDGYQASHSAADRALIVPLLNTYLTNNGSDWSSDGWNDDIGWMVNPFIRGYQFTGQANFLTVAENNWNMNYNRGWDSSLGGGIWENSSKGGKEALSNDAMIFEGVQLYQLTGDSTYLTKAEAIYAWVRSNLVNTTSSNNTLGLPGQVNQGINANGTLSSGDGYYNAGTWIKAATNLYRVTGVQQYHDDAVRTINHVMAGQPILHSSGKCCGQQWAYWATQGISEFATNNSAWGTYLTYMQNNATAAWNERSSTNLTWNDWTTHTDVTGTDGMEMGSGAEVQQNLPPAALSLSGTWEIQNVNSGLSLNIKGASTAAGAIVQQYAFSSGQNNALWTFVPTSGGYYQIKNVNSGMVLNVSGGVTTNALAGALIDQTNQAGMMPGNQQWMPVKNPDGSYSFYSLNSYQALDVPGASKSSGVQLDQWFGNGATNQEFKLIAH